MVRITNDLPMSIDSMLQDICQFYGNLEYSNIYNFKRTDENIKTLRRFQKLWADSLDSEDEETEELASKISAFVLNNQM